VIGRRLHEGEGEGQHTYIQTYNCVLERVDCGAGRRNVNSGRFGYRASAGNRTKTWIHLINYIHNRKQSSWQWWKNGEFKLLIYLIR